MKDDNHNHTHQIIMGKYNRPLRYKPENSPFNSARAMNTFTVICDGHKTGYEKKLKP